MKKCLRWINLQVVSKDKCNNGIKRKKLYWTKREGMPFSGMIKLKVLKVCRIKSIIIKKDSMTQNIATVKNEKRRKKKMKEEKGKEKKKIK